MCAKVFLYAGCSSSGRKKRSSSGDFLFSKNSQEESFFVCSLSLFYTFLRIWDFHSFNLRPRPRLKLELRRLRAKKTKLKERKSKTKVFHEMLSRNLLKKTKVHAEICANKAVFCTVVSLFRRRFLYADQRQLSPSYLLGLVGLVHVGKKKKDDQKESRPRTASSTTKSGHFLLHPGGKKRVSIQSNVHNKLALYMYSGLTFLSYAQCTHINRKYPRTDGGYE